MLTLGVGSWVGFGCQPRASLSFPGKLHFVALVAELFHKKVTVTTSALSLEQQEVDASSVITQLLWMLCESLECVCSIYFMSFNFQISISLFLIYYSLRMTRRHDNLERWQIFLADWLIKIRPMLCRRRKACKWRWMACFMSFRCHPGCAKPDIIHH